MWSGQLQGEMRLSRAHQGFPKSCLFILAAARADAQDQIGKSISGKRSATA